MEEVLHLLCHRVGTGDDGLQQGHDMFPSTPFQCTELVLDG